MSYGWLVYELARADLAGEIGAGETGAEQHVVGRQDICILT